MARSAASPIGGVPVGLPFNASVDADRRPVGGVAARPPKAPLSNQLLFALPSSPFGTVIDPTPGLPRSKLPFSFLLLGIHSF